MRNERIVLGEGKTRKIKAGDIILPDVRCLAPCLDKNGECLLLWSHRVATETLDKILKRTKFDYVREPFEIDVPDLDRIAQVFPKEEKALVMEFWMTFRSVVQHFMPKATPKPYYFDNGVKGGMRYHHFAWFTKDPEK